MGPSDCGKDYLELGSIRYIPESIVIAHRELLFDDSIIPPRFQTF